MREKAEIKIMRTIEPLLSAWCTIPISHETRVHDDNIVPNFGLSIKLIFFG